MRTKGVLALGVLLTGTWAYAAGEGPQEQVGEWGDPRRIEVRGTAVFQPEAVCNALNWNLDLRFAAHAGAPLCNYLRLLEEKTIAGFQQGGFPDVKARVEVHQDARRIAVTVEEGPRYIAGDLRIDIVDSGVRGCLKRALTSPWLPANARQEVTDGRDGKPRVRYVDPNGALVKVNEPVWQPGKPADFFAGHRKLIQARVDQALRELGYYATRYHVDIAPDPARRIASLAVVVQDVGKKAIVGEIVVTGNSKNTRQEILDFLKLKSGAPINARDAERMREELWASARFIKSNVAVLSPVAAQHHVDVCIDLVEYPNAPRLSEALSREEEILLKCRRWLMSPGNWKSDLVLRSHLPVGSMEFIMSPGRGILVGIGKRPEGGSSTKLETVFVGTPDHLGIYRPRSRRMMVGRGFNVPVDLSLSLALTADRESPFRCEFSFGANTERGHGEEPLRLNIQFQPSFFLALAHEHKAKCRLAGDRMLTIETEVDQWEIDAATGRVRSWKARGEETAFAGAQVAFEPSAFQLRIEAIEADSKGWENECDARKPFLSFIRFLTTDSLLFQLYGKKPPDPAAMAVLWKVLDPVSSLLEQTTSAVPPTEAKRESLQIPDSLGTEDKASWAKCLLQASAFLYHDCWPRTVGEELAWIVLGKTQYTGSEWQRVQNSRETGPLFWLVVGHLGALRDPDSGFACSRKATASLHVEQLQGECRFLWEQESAFHRCTQTVVRALCGLNDQERRDLLKLLPPQDAKYAAEGLRVLREKRDRPIKDVLPTVLEAMWRAGLEGRMRTALVGMLPQLPLVRSHSTPADSPADASSLHFARQWSDSPWDLPKPGPKNSASELPGLATPSSGGSGGLFSADRRKDSPPPSKPKPSSGGSSF